MEDEEETIDLSIRIDTGVIYLVAQILENNNLPCDSAATATQIALAIKSLQN